MSFSVNHANLVLPKIIYKNKEYNDRILNKIKAHKIFNEFDLQFSHDLKRIIALSERRRNNIKTGSLLENEINNSLIQSNELSKEILNNPLILNSKNLIKERNKLKRTNSEKLLKDIKKLINNLIDEKEIIKIDLNKRKKLFEIEKVISPINKLSKEEQLKQNKNIIDKKINDEQIILKQSIKSYLNQINNVYNNFEEKIKKNDLSINQLQKDLYLEKRKVKFPLRKSELLYYQRKKDENKDKDNKENELKINIKKILPYTKLGILAKKKNMENLLLNKSSEYLKKSNSVVDINNILNMNSKNIKINSKDYSNTPNIIYKQLLKNYHLEKDLLEKKNSINNLVDIKLPSFEEYNKIMKSKITIFRLNEYNQKNNENLNSNENKKEILKKDLIDDDEEFEILKRKKIKEDIQNLINNAQKNNNEEKLNDKNIQKEQNQYDLINLIPERKINKFSDEYSQRNKFNNILNDFNNYIKKKSINKNLLEQIINNFYFELEEKKEKEEELRKLNLLNSNDNKITIHQRKIQKNIKKYDSFNNTTFESNYLNNNSYFNNSKQTNEISYSLNNSFEKNKNKLLKDKYDILDYNIKKKNNSFNLKKQFYYREFLNFKKMYEKKEKTKKI